LQAFAILGAPFSGVPYMQNGLMTYNKLGLAKTVTPSNPKRVAGEPNSAASGRTKKIE